MKNIIKSFAHQIDGAILESNVKSNLFSLLVKMIKTSEKNINIDIEDNVTKPSEPINENLL